MSSSADSWGSQTTLKRVRTADVAVLLLDASDVHELVTMQDYYLKKQTVITYLVKVILPL